MKITGYGEDALTLWALQHQLSSILGKLGDDSNPDESVIFFRPSFGRRGNPPLMDGDVANSSQFGEFDAIIGTSRGVYLIETKWKPSSSVGGGKLSLRAEQVFRHKVFRAYLSAWRSQEFTTWQEFSAAQGSLINVEGARVPVAPVGSQLARSLERVLRDLASQDGDVKDVLLYMRSEHGPSVTLVELPTFTLVSIDCPVADGFIEISPRS